jgi:hypothetical protein
LYVRFFRLRRAEGERHGALEDDLAGNAGDAFQHAHAAPDPHHLGLDLEDVAGMNRVLEADALDAGEEREALAVFRLRQDQDGADLRDGFGEDRRRQTERAVGPEGQVPLVARHVLDPDDPFVQLELGHPIDEQERVPVRQDPFDRGVVEREGQVHVNKRLYWQMSCGLK